MVHSKGNCDLCGEDRTFVHVRELAYGKAIAVLGAVVFTFPGAILLVWSLLVLANPGELLVSLESTPMLAGLDALAIAAGALHVAWFALLLVFLGIWSARRQDVLACLTCGFFRPRLSQRVLELQRDARVRHLLAPPGAQARGAGPVPLAPGELP